MAQKQAEDAQDHLHAQLEKEFFQWQAGAITLILDHAAALESRAKLPSDPQNEEGK